MKSIILFIRIKNMGSVIEPVKKNFTCSVLFDMSGAKFLWPTSASNWLSRNKIPFVGRKVSYNFCTVTIVLKKRTLQ